MNNRRDEIRLTYHFFWTANFALYRVENGEAILYFGGREDNPIYKNIIKATTQLIEVRNFKPDKEDIQAVIDSVGSGSTLRVELSELNLIPPSLMAAQIQRSKQKRNKYDFRVFEINTSDYGQKLNNTQRILAERVFGQRNDFIKNMRMLSEDGIKTTKITVLYPPYVKDNVKKDSALIRLCSLASFSNGSFLDATYAGYYVDEDNYRFYNKQYLRGILK